MSDIILQNASLVGHVIEDLNYEPVSKNRFETKILELNKAAEYKDGGYFVFSDIHPGEYTLRMSGQRYRSEEYTLTLPFTPLYLHNPGDDELIVVATTVDSAINVIMFNPVNQPKSIRAGATILTQSVSTTLASDLNPGEITRARLESVSGISQGDIVRIVRDESIRLRFSPYQEIPVSVTRIIGKITRNDPPQIPVPCALIRVTHIGGIPFTIDNIAGVNVVSRVVGTNRRIIGTERDITTHSNERGDYTLYFEGEAEGSQLFVTFRVERTGYQPATQTVTIHRDRRNIVNFPLDRA